MLVPLLAPPSPPLGAGLAEIAQERQQTAGHRQRGQQAQQPAAGACLGQGTGETVKAVSVHHGPFRRSTYRR
jgi:hypothetical protein